MNRRIPTAGRVLIIDADEHLGALYADLIRTHCPGLRVDCCRPDQQTLIDDNAGGADLAILSCGQTAATALDALRAALAARPCLRTLVLVPADRPHIADAAVDAGGSDVLLKAPGYLDQIAVVVRKNIALARTDLASRARSRTMARALCIAHDQIAELRAELAATTGNMHAVTTPSIGTIRINPTRMAQPTPRVHIPAATARQAA